MYPELFELPFIHQTIKSYGLMMVIGFIAAVYLIRRLSKDITPDPQYITNAALYSLIAGVVGGRLFYVVHYFEQFKGDLFGVFAIWEGGLELLGGVFFSVAVIVLYLRHNKLPARKYLDILAIALFLALSFGRIGCFLNGCCFGRPSQLPWAVRFPYGSLVYNSQIQPDTSRGRTEPYIKLPDDFFNHYENENGKLARILKPYSELTDLQKDMVKNGQYRILPVHPTQLYSSANAAVLCGVLYLFWRRSRKAHKTGDKNRILTAPGDTFGLLFILYGVTRFFIEFVRDDNPFEFDGLTVSQNIAIVMLLFGVVLMAVFEKFKPQE